MAKEEHSLFRLIWDENLGDAALYGEDTEDSLNTDHSIPIGWDQAN